MDVNEKMKEIAERIKKRREELTLSYDELEKKTGIKKSMIIKYETEEISNIPLDKFETLAKGLEIDPAKLMGCDEEYL